MRTVVESEWDGTRFPRDHTTGVVLGLRASQVGFLAVSLAVSVAVLFGVGVPYGFILAIPMAIVLGVFGVLKFWGRPLVDWVYYVVRFRIRGSKDQLRYRRPLPVVEIPDDDGGTEEDDEVGPGVVDEDEEFFGGRDKHGRITPGPGHRFGLPGEVNELVGYELPGGIGFVWDPVRREGMVTAQLHTEKAFDLESFDGMESRTRAYRNALTSMAGMPGIERWQLSDQTTLVSGAKVVSYYEEKGQQAVPVEDGESGAWVPQSGSVINPFLDSSFRDLMNEAQGMPIHELWVTVVFSASKLENRATAAGGGLRGFMEICLGIMTNVEAVLPSSGVWVSGWHTLRTWAALSRSAFDPDSTLMISERTGDHTGVRPEEAGPMAMDVTPSYVESDGVKHRTYVISEWPQDQAQLGFLESFIFSGEFRHTVTLCFKPRDARAALNTTQRRKGDHQASDSMRRKLDRPESLEHRREIEDIEQEEQELVRGNASLKQVGLITVSGRDLRELEANCGELLARAARANCELRVLWAEQDNGFVAAALPFAQVVIP